MTQKSQAVPPAHSYPHPTSIPARSYSHRYPHPIPVSSQSHPHPIPIPTAIPIPPPLPPPYSCCSRANTSGSSCAGLRQSRRRGAVAAAPSLRRHSRSISKLHSAVRCGLFSRICSRRQRRCALRCQSAPRCKLLSRRCC